MRELAITLPEPNRPGAYDLPFVVSGNLVFLTGQPPQWNGTRKFIGKLNREFGLAEGRAAARLCAINLIAHLRTALDGDLDRVARCLRVAGYVNATPDFALQSQVVDGASDVIVAVFGDPGRHVRIAVGVAALPYDVAVEVEAAFEIR